MDQRWFILHSGSVQGPLSTSEIEHRLGQGEWSIDAMVWWKGSPEWIPLTIWKANLEKIEEDIRRMHDPAIWFIECSGLHRGPLSKSEIIDMAKEKGDPSQIRLWKMGLEEWKSIFQFKDFLESLGIPQRLHSRIPFRGIVNIQTLTEQITAPAVSLSFGGIGVSQFNINTQDHLDLTIMSPGMGMPIKATGQLRYLNKQGVAGLSFVNLSSSAQVTIMDYIRQSTYGNKKAS